ncbi:MAG: CapA family protein [Oscillospiraceae bacterium]|nr:CapA family protein [Oscillospiraceae bacterium]MBQ9938515.1 CapA family protein [Oscillospiraceae bacterium]
MLSVLLLMFAACEKQEEMNSGESVILQPSQQPSESEQSSESESDSESDQETSEEESSSEDEPKEIYLSAKLSAVGDNLIHDTLYNQALRRTGGEYYNFLPVYDNVAELIKTADIAVVNQETPMSKSNPPSNYPMFNCPTDMAEQLVQLGFDVATIANNHMLDQGAAGLAETVELLRSVEGLSVAGAYLDSSEWENIAVVEANGIKFAFLSYTQSTNGIPLPKGKEGMIIFTSNEAAIKQQIELAKQQADVVVVSAHWGVEYTHTPGKEQKELAAKLAEFGADIVIGHHPHVIQPYEWIDGTLVIYSLGNFVSAQNKPETMIGAMFNIDVELEKVSGRVKISEPEIIPMITHYDAGNYNVRLYTLEQYSEELAAKHGIVLSHKKQFSVEFIRATLKEVYGYDF